MDVAHRAETSQHTADFHEAVMVEEVIDHLVVGAGGFYVDGTVGGGGHTEAILEATAPEGRLLGVDRDPEAIEASRRRLESFDDRVELVRGNYAELPSILERSDAPGVDGLLVDAGVSSHQLDRPERGFSFRQEGPLDMRMGPDAEDLETYLGRTTSHALTEALRDYGEVPAAGRIAEAILEAYEAEELETTADLAETVESTGVRGRSGRVPTARVFQALRIELNDELDHLRRLVESVPSIVRSGGRAVVISFHSLEDRIVKHGFRDLATECTCPPGLPVCGCDAVADVEVLTSSLVRPSEQEVERNSRARSARLRAAEIR